MAVKRAVERAVRKAVSWAHQMAPQRVAKTDTLKVENSVACSVKTKAERKVSWKAATLA